MNYSIIWVIFGLDVITCEAVPQNTVILLGGYMGNQLHYSPRINCYCVPASSTLWFDVFKFLLCPEEWLRISKLNYSTADKYSYSENGVTVNVPVIGSTNSMEYIAPFPQQIEMTSYFIKIINCLKSKGYRVGYDLYGAPRDWRRAPHELMQHFKDLIHLVEFSFKKTRKRVVFVCHSMGGNIATLFLAKQTKAWKDKYISKMITIGTPHGGGVKCLQGYLRDKDYPANMFPVIRKAEITYSAYAFLLPSQGTWGENVLIQTPKKKYTANNLDEFFSKIGNEKAYQMYSDANKFVPRDFPHPECNVLCIGGLLKESTFRKLIYDDNDFKSQPNIIYGDGDTFVNDEALRRCLLWNRTDTEYSFDFKVFSADHLGLIRDAESVKYICEAAAASI